MLPAARRIGNERATFLQSPPDHVLEGDSEGLREPPKGQDRHVVLGPFDRAYVGPVDAALEGEFFLGSALGFSRLPQIGTKSD